MNCGWLCHLFVDYSILMEDGKGRWPELGRVFSLRLTVFFPQRYRISESYVDPFFSTLEPDVQSFLVSMLTVVALMDGIIESLTDHHCRAAAGKLKPRPTVEDHYRDIRLARKKSCAKAKEDAEGVFCDIQALTGITDVYYFFVGVCLILTD